jgi:hypothetical protein
MYQAAEVFLVQARLRGLADRRLAVFREAVVKP